jgi:ribosomal protein S27AE
VFSRGPVEPSAIPFKRPRCSRCHARMMLARVEPGPAGSVLRTFECPKCGHVQKVLAEQPMESDMSGWLNSRELRPPE